MTIKQQGRVLLALRTISKCQTPAQLRRNAYSEYGVTYYEALEMAYENILVTAKRASRGVYMPEAKKKLST